MRNTQGKNTKFVNVIAEANESDIYGIIFSGLSTAYRPQQLLLSILIGRSQRLRSKLTGEKLFRNEL